MALMLDQGLMMARTTMVFGILGIMAVPVWAEESQDAIREKERTARISELQRERTKVEDELRRLQSQPEGMARSTVPRSEFSDQPTRSIKESLESVPGVNLQQGSSGRDLQLSIRGSK